MEDKFYRSGWCYYVCGNTDNRLERINEIANSFADEVGASFANVHYEGVISNSNWCKGFQLYSTPTLNPPTHYHSIEVSASQYLKSR